MENKGMFRIGSVDCKEFKAICDKEDVKEYPAYKVYQGYPWFFFGGGAFLGSFVDECVTGRMFRLCVYARS